MSTQDEDISRTLADDLRAEAERSYRRYLFETQVRGRILSWEEAREIGRLAGESVEREIRRA